MAPEKRPNILYIMADQMAAPMLPMYNENSPIIAPNMQKLAKDGVVFESAYCNSPLCAPSRFTMVTGQLPSKIEGYDNASQFSSEVPTFAHYLRKQGYHTALSGKMHFIGADQLHGFEERLTPDIYPGDFGWTVNWDDPEIRPDWYHNMSSVLDAGPIVRTNQLDYDEEVLYKSTQYLYNHVRQRKEQPFCLTVSMTHPHDPYNMTKDFWDLYENVDIPLPETSAIPHDQQDPHARRVLKCIDLLGKEMPEDRIRAARRAYFSACTYVDSNIGKLLKCLDDCGLSDDTIIVFSGDHGDNLGERGLWYKMTWYEMSARVPLLVYNPKLYPARRVKESVSTMDLMPTFVEMGGTKVDPQLPLDGLSLMPYINGAEGPKADTVIAEYMGEGTSCPLVMIRRGKWKFVYAPTDPPQLFDVEKDPHELNNLAAGFSGTVSRTAGTTAANGVANTLPNSKEAASLAANNLSEAIDSSTVNGVAHPTRVNGVPAEPISPPATPSNGQIKEYIPSDSDSVEATVAAFLEEVATRWDMDKITKDVLASQRRRRLVNAALTKGVYISWEWATPADHGGVYVRNRQGALEDFEGGSRIALPKTAAY